MELTMTYKKVLAVVVLLLVGFMSQAQQFVVVGSARTFRVPEVSGHAYQWEVLDVDGDPQKLTLNAKGEYILDSSGVESVGGLDALLDTNRALHAIIIKWKREGKYTLRLTEANLSGCVTVNLTNVQVVKTPLRFTVKDMAKYAVVASYGDVRKIEIPVEFKKIPDKVDGTSEYNTAFNAWKDAYYALHNDDTYRLSFGYKLYHESGIVTPSDASKQMVVVHTLKNDGVFVYDCAVDYSDDFGNNLVETDLDPTDRYFEFELKSVSDKYGASVAVEGNDKFVFGVYKKAPITKINHK